MLRHTLATLAYRGARHFAERPKDFSDFAHRHPRELRARFLLTSETCSIGRYRLHRGKTGVATTPSCSPGKWIAKVLYRACGLRCDTWLGRNSGPGGKNSFRARSPSSDARGPNRHSAAGCRRSCRAENYFRAEIVAGRSAPIRPRRNANSTNQEIIGHARDSPTHLILAAG